MNWKAAVGFAIGAIVFTCFLVAEAWLCFLAAEWFGLGELAGGGFFAAVLLAEVALFVGWATSE